MVHLCALVHFERVFLSTLGSSCMVHLCALVHSPFILHHSLVYAMPEYTPMIQCQPFQTFCNVKYHWIAKRKSPSLPPPSPLKCELQVWKLFGFYFSSLNFTNSDFSWKKIQNIFASQICFLTPFPQPLPQPKIDQMDIFFCSNWCWILSYIQTWQGQVES